MGAAVTQEANATGPLLPAVEGIAERLQRKPEQRVADVGYPAQARPSRRGPKERWIFWGACREKTRPRGGPLLHRLPPKAFIFQPGTNRYVCAAGKFLRHEGCCQKERGQVSSRCWAKAEDGLSGARNPECGPENRSGRGILRLEESAGDLTLRQKVESEEAGGKLSSAWQSRGILPCLD